MPIILTEAGAESAGPFLHVAVFMEHDDDYLVFGSKPYDMMGLHAWTLQGCQMSWRQMSWRQMLWRHMVYSQRRDNHHRAPRTPQHAEKVLQTQHPLLSIYWAQGRRKVR